MTTNNQQVNPLPKRKSSGCVVFRTEGKNIDVLLVTSSRSGDWILPKGGISVTMSERDSAAKEAYEEAGVLGSIGMKLGDYQCVKGDMVQDVSMFAMSFSGFAEDWPEKHVRRREWFDARQAMKLVDPYLAYFINQLIEAVEADWVHETNKKADDIGTL